MNFIESIFDTSGFPPRWFCGSWTDFLGWTHIISDLVIWAAYMAIPIALFYFISKRKNLPFSWIFLLFIAFIFSCGIVHLVEASIFWQPWYRLSALIKAITAIVSVTTVWALVKILPDALELKTPEDLKKSVAHRTKELAKLSTLLKSKNEELENFAYMASHDLQEPIRMVKNYTHLLEQKYSENLDDKAKKYIAYATEGAETMQELINSLLEYSRLSHSKLELEEVDTQKLLKTLTTSLLSSVEEKHAVIEFNNMPKVLANKAQLLSVFQNLITNSIKYCKERTPLIKISASENDHEWLFELEDNGIGFDPKHSEDIFELFKRLHSKKKFKGNGMGLSLCKKIIENHGGFIKAESKPGLGSTFSFSLPKSSSR